MDAEQDESVPPVLADKKRKNSPEDRSDVWFDRQMKEFATMSYVSSAHSFQPENSSKIVFNHPALSFYMWK